MTERQVDKLTRMFEEAFAYADKNEIFVTITPTGIEIEGRYAVKLPRTYTIVKTDEEVSAGV